MNKLMNEDIMELEKIVAKKEAEIAEMQKEMERKIAYLNKVKAQLAEEIEAEQVKQDTLPKPTIEELIVEFQAQGFTVECKGSWLWNVGYDGRYDKEIKSAYGTTLIDRNSESRKLKELGFKYSVNRQQWYYIYK